MAKTLQVRALIGGCLGDVNFEAGDLIEAADIAQKQAWIAAGVAESEDPVADRFTQLDVMTVLALRDLAAELDIPGRTTLSKADLIAAIMDAEGE